MRIAIDGFNLGLIQGTGLATYARELSHVLSKAGHAVLPIYGLRHIHDDKQLSWPSFIQALSNEGEAARTAYQRWLLAAVRYLPHALLPTSGIPLDHVYINENIQLGAVSARLPTFERVYNCPGIFRAAQMYASLFARPLTLSPPPEGVDVLHLTCPLPLRMLGVKTIVTVHDIIPLMLPHSTSVNLRHYQRLTRVVLQQADMLFCISETTQRDVMRWFGIPPERIHLTYQAVNIPSVYQNLSSEVVNTFLYNNFKLEKDKYFLYFGAVEPKKNVARIIDAMTMAKTELPLVIVGKDGWLFDDVTARLKNTRKDKVIRLEYLSFSHLMYLVKGARALVFPSLYEGFGLPVLEAMQMGCPVITANTTSLSEVAGDAALTVNPNDTDAIRIAIELLAQNDNLCQELSEKGYERARQFSPEKHTERLAEGYARAGLVWQ